VSALAVSGAVETRTDGAPVKHSAGLDGSTTGTQWETSVSPPLRKRPTKHATSQAVCWRSGVTGWRVSSGGVAGRRSGWRKRLRRCVQIQTPKRRERGDRYCGSEGRRFDVGVFRQWKSQADVS